MVNKDEIEKIFRENFFVQYKAEIDIDDQGFVSVSNSDSVELYGHKKHDRLPVKFRTITGNLDVSKNNLTTLEGCPEVVPGWFKCDDNRLPNLVGGPRHVGTKAGTRGFYSAVFHAYNPMKDLKGLPETVGGILYVSYTPSLPLLGICLVKKQEVHFTDTISDEIDNKHDPDLEDYQDYHIKSLNPHLSDLEDVFNRPEHQGPAGVLRMASAMSELDQYWGEGTLDKNASI